MPKKEPPKISVHTTMPGEDGADAVMSVVGLMALLVWQNGGQLKIEGLDKAPVLRLYGDYDDDGGGITLRAELFNPQSGGT